MTVLQIILQRSLRRRSLSRPILALQAHICGLSTAIADSLSVLAPSLYMGYRGRVQVSPGERRVIVSLNDPDFRYCTSVSPVNGVRGMRFDRSLRKGSLGDIRGMTKIKDR